MTCRETILAELPGESDDERLLVVHCVRSVSAAGLSHAGLSHAGPSHVELRQQTWADKIGWFTQSSVRLSPAQLGALRLTLGTAAPAAHKPAAAFRPRVVHADSA